MSWFLLKEQPVRKKRKGIFLRYSFNKDVFQAVKKSGLMRMTESVQWVSICELRPEGKVLLEVWCQSFVDVLRHRMRYNVLHIIMDENEKWVCEGDLGRGLK